MEEGRLYRVNTRPRDIGGASLYELFRMLMMKIYNMCPIELKDTYDVRHCKD
jgi:hypothetical protein